MKAPRPVLAFGNTQKCSFPYLYTTLLFQAGVPSSDLIQGSLQRLYCGGLNNLLKNYQTAVSRSVFATLRHQWKHISFIKSAVCGQIDQGPAGLFDKVKASHFSSWKAGSSVCVALIGGAFPLTYCLTECCEKTESPKTGKGVRF